MGGGLQPPTAVGVSGRKNVSMAEIFLSLHGFPLSRVFLREISQRCRPENEAVALL